IGKDFVLHGEEDTGTVDQINDWEPVLHGYLLCAQILFGGNRKPGTCLYGRIVGHVDTLPFVAIANSGYYPATGAPARFGGLAVTCEESDFKKFRVFVDQVLNTFPRCQLPPLVLFFDLLFSTTGFDFFLT